MIINQPSTLKVGTASSTITLNTANLVSEFSITDPYWSVPANWSAVDFHYFDATSTNHRILTFISSGYTNVFQTSTKAKPNTWVVMKIVIRDNDGGAYIIDRNQFLTGQSQFDIIMQALIGPTKYVYTVNQDSGIGGSVSPFSLDDVTGQLTRISSDLVFSLGGGNVATGIAATPNGKWLYAGSQLGIKRMSIDSGTGAIALLGTTGSDYIPYPIISPNGANLYSGHFDGSSTILQYSINDSDGSLTPLSPASVSVDGTNGAWRMAITPNGKWLYAPTAAGTVYCYSIDGTGHLTALSPAFYATGAGNYNADVSPDGASLYVSNQTDQTITEFSINDSTGALTLIGTTAVSGVTFSGGAVTTDGAHFEVAGNNGYLTHYTRDTGTGLLTHVSDLVVSSTPQKVVVTPNGKWLFLAIGGASQLKTYSITAGVVTLSDTDTTGNLPVGIALVS